MNWLTLTCSMAAAASLTLALLHAVIWLRDRSSRVHFLFALAAFSVCGIALAELQMMLTQTPEEYGRWVRWIHVPIGVAIVAIVWFVRCYFNAGRLWLAWSICGIRALVLALNFLVSPNLNYAEITAIRQVEIGSGDTVSTPVGTVSARSRLGELGSLLLLVFAADASITVWRRGNRTERARALSVGGSLVCFVLLGAGHVTLIHLGLIHWPYVISLGFMMPVAAMGYQLGADVVQAGRLTRELDSSRAELKENQQRMELVVTAAQLGLWRWDIARDELWVSDQARTLLGLNGDDRINLSKFLAALVPEDREEVRRAVTESVRGGLDYEREYRVQLPRGAVRWIAARGSIEFNGKHQPRFMRGVCFDITQRKQAEERFRLVVEAAPNAMIVVGAGGAISLVNRQAEQVFGYNRHELIGQPIETLIPESLRAMHEEDRGRYMESPRACAMAAGRELYGRRKDGSQVPVEIGLNPINTAEGIFILASIIDVTERRLAEREQVRQRSELAHLSRVAMLGELSGSLAHELNQPLTAILSNAQAAQGFLSSDPVDLTEVRSILQDIVDEDRRAGEVIRKLRLLFRKGEVQYEPLDLNQVVQEVVSLMNADLVNHGVVVRTELARNLPPVRGDRVQLQQVLINLIVNASDAMASCEPGHRILRVSTWRQPDQSIALKVSDSGCGVPPDDLERIFEPFHTTKTSGMGLGLAVCRTIISAQGGRLWAANNPDRGASFHVSFTSIPGAR